MCTEPKLVGQGFGPVPMGLRPTNRHEKIVESLPHPISRPVLVKVEAAVGNSRPWLCLIRSVRLNERVRKKRERVLSFFPGTLSSLVWRRDGKGISHSGYIDVHKKMLAVVVTDAARVGEFRFERRKFGAGAGDLRVLEAWLAERGVKEVVMESTAQYWKPVWQAALEGRYRLELAQAHSNKAPKGRKRDFADAERLARRCVAGELILSFVPSEEQRLWRTMTRTEATTDAGSRAAAGAVGGISGRGADQAFQPRQRFCWA